MDPNNQNSQGENVAVTKLEQDLQSLKQQTTTVPQQPAPIEQPVTQSPPVPEVLSTTSSSFVSPSVPVDTGVSVPESPKKGSPLMIVAIILAVIAVLAVLAYVFGAKLFSSTPKEVVCTQEAKICPDGTSVGRTGPNCEFAVCPTASATPVVTLVSTASPSASPIVIPTASASVKPTSTPTSSPTTTP